MQRHYPLIIAAVLIMPFVGFSQNGKPGYVNTDSAHLIGKIVVISDSEIRFTRSVSLSERFTASQIREYEYGGQIFESIMKDGSQRFYKRLVDGQVKVYEEGDGFFLITGDTIISLDRKNFREQIRKSLSCPAIDKVVFTSPALKNFFNQYNNLKCGIKFIPHARFGVSAGINDLTVTRKIDEVKFKTKKYTPSIALFYEQPLYLWNGLFATAELSIAYNSADFYTIDNTRSYYYRFDNLIASGQIGLKYVVSSRYIRPFFKAGTMPSYIIHKPTTEMSNTYTDGSVIEITYAEVTEERKSEWGFYTNAGVEMNIGTQSMLVLEVRYNNSASWSSVGISLALSF